MNELSKNILVFKTSINEEDLIKIAALLDTHQHIQRWTVDTGDCDKVLRLEVNKTITEEIIKLIQNAGYICEELN